ncbi:MAG: hypothetical protein CL843_16390 [Crocinitomicaceae bacterium]|nr:hypothetical protein [Crocinitomicaceae bacterium]
MLLIYPWPHYLFEIDFCPRSTVFDIESGFKNSMVSVGFKKVVGSYVLSVRNFCMLNSELQINNFKAL